MQANAKTSVLKRLKRIEGQVRGVARNQNPAGLVTLGHQRLAGAPGMMTQYLDLDVGADRPFDPVGDLCRVDAGVAVLRLDQHMRNRLLRIAAARDFD